MFDQYDTVYADNGPTSIACPTSQSVRFKPPKYIGSMVDLVFPIQTWRIQINQRDARLLHLCRVGECLQERL